jgi:predicted DNA-binding helix-hairpin-helix protein
MREHRLYQADWLIRYYGFSTGELTAAIPTGNFDLDLDPKTTWALRHRKQFPLDVNTATRELLLRVPGLGVRAVDRIVASRRQGKLRYADLITLGASLRKAKHFIVAADYAPRAESSSAHLRGLLAGSVTRQSDLFQ